VYRGAVAVGSGLNETLRWRTVESRIHRHIMVEGFVERKIVGPRGRGGPHFVSFARVWSWLLHTNRRWLFVPEGRRIIAQQFTAGER
jgi:hypothetical protein